MSFLAPLFLLGLGAVAVPILIHLTHKERRDPIVFPSLMFLRKVPFKTQRRQRIRHWLLFLLRAAAVVLFVVAFARPLLRGAVLGATASGTAREVVLLLDRSYSMAYGDRWTRAVAAARDVIAKVTPEDRLSIVTFAERAAVLNQPSGDLVRLADLLDDVRPGAGATRYAAALQLARDLLDQSELPHREAVLITDFQRAGWAGTGDVRLPAGATLTHVDVSDGPQSNRAVAGVLLDRSPENGGRVIVSARVTNAGPEDVHDLSVQLAVNGQVLQTQTLDVPANGSALARFAAIALPAAPVPAQVDIAQDALPVDDIYHFLLRPIPRIPVLLVEHPNAPADETVYLRRALEIGRDPAFDVTVRRTPRLGAAELAGAAVIVFNDIPLPSGEPGRRLAQFIADGGGVLVAFGRRTGGLPSVFRDSLGSLSGEPVDRLDDRGGTLSVTAYRHPVFRPFASPRSGDFSAARFFRYRRLAVPAGVTALARFDDGSAALTEASYGAGRILLWASDFGNQWSNLPLQPIFLPFMHQTVRYLANFREPPNAYVAGQVLDIAALGFPAGEELVVESPSGERAAIRLDTDETHIELNEAGVYAIHPLGRRAGEGVVAPVNPDLRESDLTPFDPEELLAAARPADATRETDVVALAELTPVERERRQGVWWILLLAGLGLLVAESAVATRLSAVRR